MRIARRTCESICTVLLLCGFCVSSLRAAPHLPNEEIQAAYNKACVAIGLKYMAGVLSIRDRHFEAFSPDGQRQDLTYERARWQQLFGPALSAKETVEILSFRQTDPTHAICEIHQVLEIEIIDSSSRKTSLVLDSRSQDDWQITPRGWKQKASHIHEQSFKKKDSAPSAQSNEQAR